MNKKTARMKTVQEPPAGYNESAVMIYQSPEGIRVDVTVKRDTVWLSLNQMTTLFDRDKSVISRHLRNVFKEGELDRAAVVAFFATVQGIAELIKDSVCANFATTAADGNNEYGCSGTCSGSPKGSERVPGIRSRKKRPISSIPSSRIIPSWTVINGSALPCFCGLWKRTVPCIVQTEPSASQTMPSSP